MRREFVVALLAALALSINHGASAQFQNTIVVQRAFTVPPSNGSFTDAAINCPAGYDAIAGGLDNVNSTTFEISDHAPTFSDVPLFQQPNGTRSAANGWHASVINNDSASRQAVVSVVCAPSSGTVVVINSVTVTAAGASGPGSGYQQSDCPSGQVALSGGIDVAHPEAMKLVATSGFYPGTVNFILDLPPGQNPPPSGWSMLTSNQGPNTGLMKVAAICSSAPGVITMISDLMTIQANTHLGIALSCPAGYVAIGGGFDTNAVDWLIATVDSPLYNNAPARPADRSDGQYGAPTGWFADTFSHSTDGDRKLKSGVVCVPVRHGDVDLDGAYTAMTDGLLIMRYLFGSTGSQLVSNAIGNNAQRSDPTDIRNYLDSIRAQLDIDLNGHSDALTDGLLIIRYLSGMRGSALLNGAIGPGATRQNSADVEAYLGTLFGP